MIPVDRPTRFAIWGMVAIVLTAGWVAFGMLASDSQLFLVTMVVVSILLGGVAVFLVRTRTPSTPVRP
jgi:hypothetical protein